ncbi:lactonase family protein [Namhaeicola litoreus]|uniref:Lactonase family protein n=1 Tax=Namhaeicola litoreus TaxID=1052145 RepID=A0ABW3Y545_9FLAO
MVDLSFCLKRVVLVLNLVCFSLYSQKTKETFLFVGSFTNGEIGNGIHVYTFNQQNGSSELVHSENGLINSSFLALSPNGKYLYAATDTQLKTEGYVSSFYVDSETGNLKFLNKQLAGGRNPVHINLHPKGEFLINSNYTDAGISLFPIKEDGTLSAYTELFTFEGSSVLQPRQDKAHVHSSNFSPKGDYLFVMDLGTDKIYSFKVENDQVGKNTLVKRESIQTVKGSGPRHLTFHPTRNYVYAVNELNGSVTAYKYENGNLISLQNILCYEKGVKVFQSADIHCSPDGKFLYVSNRGSEENSIVIFSIEANSGRLELVGRTPTFGEHPRSFAIDPSGKFLLVANQFTNNIIVFKRDAKTGLLTKTNNDIEVNAPASLKMFSYFLSN